MWGRQGKGKGQVQGPNLMVGAACQAPVVEAVGDRARQQGVL